MCRKSMMLDGEDLAARHLLRLLHRPTAYGGGANSSATLFG